MMGVFGGVTEALRELWKGGGIEIRAEMVLPGMVGVLLTAGVSFGVISAILRTSGAGRRTILGFSVFFFSLMLVPAFAVCEIFWKPFGVLLAVGWSWFSAMIYAQTHRMPCEVAQEWEAENVIQMEDDREVEESKSRVS